MFDSMYLICMFTDVSVNCGLIVMVFLFLFLPGILLRWSHIIDIILPWVQNKKDKKEKRL